MGEAAAAISIASAGLGAASSITKGQGTQAADNMQADRLTRAAEFGKLQSNLTDTVDREQLSTTLGNIAVMRTAGRNDPTSPTTAAITDRETMIGDRQRTSQLLNIRSQVQEDQDSAAYLRKAGDFALLQGYLSAGAGLGGALGKGLSGKPGFFGGSPEDNPLLKVIGG